MAPPELPATRALDVRRPFARVDAFDRLGRQLELNQSSRVLEVGAGELSAGVHLARDLGCDAVAASPSAAVLEALKQDLKTDPPQGHVELREAAFSQLSFRDHDFDAIIVSDRQAAPFVQLVQALRPLLVERGRICITYPVKVGRYPLAAAVESWEKRLGEPLVYPKDLLRVLTENGLEAKWVETMGDLELDDLYRAAEQAGGPSKKEEALLLGEEASLHRSQAGRASVTFAWLMGRRKEPGEKLPATRDRG